LFELSRLDFHYDLTGYARLNAPIVSALLYTTFSKIVLKLWNLVVLGFLPFMLLRMKCRRQSLRDEWLQRSPEFRASVKICAAYALAYLAVYGFSSTVVRNAYPLAPVLLAVNLLVFTAKPADANLTG